MDREVCVLRGAGVGGGGWVMFTSPGSILQ